MRAILLALMLLVSPVLMGANWTSGPSGVAGSCDKMTHGGLPQACYSDFSTDVEPTAALDLRRCLSVDVEMFPDTGGTAVTSVVQLYSCTSSASPSTTNCNTLGSALTSSNTTVQGSGINYLWYDVTTFAAGSEPRLRVRCLAASSGDAGGGGAADPTVPVNGECGTQCVEKFRRLTTLSAPDFSGKPWAGPYFVSPDAGGLLPQGVIGNPGTRELPFFSLEEASAVCGEHSIIEIDDQDTFTLTEIGTTATSFTCTGTVGANEIMGWVRPMTPGGRIVVDNTLYVRPGASSGIFESKGTGNLVVEGVDITLVPGVTETDGFISFDTSKLWVIDANFAHSEIVTQVLSSHDESWIAPVNVTGYFNERGLAGGNSFAIGHRSFAMKESLTNTVHDFFTLAVGGSFGPSVGHLVFIGYNLSGQVLTGSAGVSRAFVGAPSTLQNTNKAYYTIVNPSFSGLDHNRNTVNSNPDYAIHITSDVGNSDVDVRVHGVSAQDLNGFLFMSGTLATSTVVVDGMILGDVEQDNVNRYFINLNGSKCVAGNTLSITNWKMGPKTVGAFVGAPFGSWESQACDGADVSTIALVETNAAAGGMTVDLTTGYTLMANSPFVTATSYCDPTAVDPDDCEYGEHTAGFRIGQDRMPLTIPGELMGGEITSLVVGSDQLGAN